MPISTGTLTKTNAMTASAASVMTAKSPSCSHIRRDNLSMLVAVPVIGRDQRIASGVRTRHLDDRAPPLQLERGKIPPPRRPGEQAAVEPAQREVDDQGDVGEVTP